MLCLHDLVQSFCKTIFRKCINYLPFQTRYYCFHNLLHKCSSHLNRSLSKFIHENCMPRIMILSLPRICMATSHLRIAQTIMFLIDKSLILFYIIPFSQKMQTKCVFKCTEYVDIIISLWVLLCLGKIYWIVIWCWYTFYDSYRNSEGGCGSYVRCAFTWHADGRRFDHRVRQHSFMKIDHEIISMAILSLPLIQVGQLSVTGERMCT